MAPWGFTATAVISLERVTPTSARGTAESSMVHSAKLSKPHSSSRLLSVNTTRVRLPLSSTMSSVPSKTQIRVRSPRFAAETRHFPAALVVPVFTPMARG